MNGDKINGRTPEEIKRGLECCNTIYGCKQCPYDVGDEDLSCCVKRNADILAYIQQLEDRIRLLRAYNEGTLQKIVQLERERDEARNDLDTINYANTELHSAYEAMKRERDAARDMHYQASKEATDSYYSLLREFDAAMEMLYGKCFACKHSRHGKLDKRSGFCQRCLFNVKAVGGYDLDYYWQYRGIQEVKE
jgi:hypothetical protein